MKRCLLCGNKQNLFSVPTNFEESAKWANIIGTQLTHNNKICINHFKKEDVIQNKTVKIDGNTIQIPSIRKLLRKGALPVVNCGQSTSNTSQSCENELQVTKTDNLKTYIPSYNCSNPVRDIAPINTEESANSERLPLFECLYKHDCKNSQEWGVHKNNTQIVYTKLSNLHLQQNIVKIEKAVIINDQCKATIILNDYTWQSICLQKLDDLINLLENLNYINVCFGKNSRYSKKCNRIIKNQKTSCDYCLRLKSQLPTYGANTTIRRLNYKLKNKIREEKKNHLKQNRLHTERLNTLMATLPDDQKDIIKMCIKSSKRSSKGNRYSADWMYSCILMKIKSPKLYFHMRNRNMLPLPSNSTLCRYMRNLNSSFGFQDELFHLISRKTNSIPEYERHGTLMIDECKISESKHFDKNKIKIIGFVDLGKYTANSQKNKLGDHVLVFMFQSFSGKNMQALGCFLTRGNVTGKVQAKLVLECVLLCEKAGLYVDVITSDGATWNRNMWKCFGIDNCQEPWFAHPVDNKRKLRMCSDFPHLLKCIRNRLLAKQMLHVAEGIVKLEHFMVLLHHEESFSFKYAYKLTQRHINPQNHEKMTNSLAFQLFSETNAIAFEKYKDVPGLEDSAATAQFCRRVNALSDVLNSNNPQNALHLNSKQYGVLEDFIIYLNLWEQCADSDYYLTKSTSEGLLATIHTTMDLVKYLVTELGYKYLMTARINQDPLEHFFGLMRAACGDNSHPESYQVAQIFKLMSLYSLIKPPRGSNITGGNMLETLVKSKDILKTADASLKNEYLKKLDELVDGDIHAVIEELPFSDNEEAFAYVSGYIARRYKTKMLACPECFHTLVGTGNENYADFIKVKSRSSLTVPSTMLLTILKNIEIIIQDIVKKDLKQNALLEIVQAVATSGKLAGYVGCEDHKKHVTKQVIFDFLMIRVAFCCKEESRKRLAEKSKRQEYAKLSKLV